MLTSADRIRLKAKETKQDFEKKYPHVKKFLDNRGVELGKIRQHSAKVIAAGALTGSLFLSPPIGLPALPQSFEVNRVGRKTANLVLNRAFEIPAIAVDTHVHKISNLLGWVKTKTPEKTEIELQKILPKKYWPETNKLFVGMGRKFTSKKKLVEFLKDQKLI